MKHASALVKIVLIGVLWWVGVGVWVGQVEAGCTGQYKCKPHLPNGACNQAPSAVFVSACTGNTSSACLDSPIRDTECCETLGSWNECAFDGGGSNPTPTPTTPASCGNGTCGSGESCSNCPADCGVCTEITWAYITVTVYGDNGLQAPSNRTQEPSSGSNTCKGYEFASSSTGTSWNAYGNCQHSWLLDMAKTDKSMNISGIDSKYSDCQVKLNNTVINSSFANGKCSVPSRTYNQYNDSLVITLLKSRPNADFTAGPANNTEIGYGLNYQWTNSATDANGNMKSWGIYVREKGGSFSPIGWFSNNSGVASATITSNTWSCSKKNQEYEIAVNAKEGDPPLLECSGGSANAYNITSTQAQTRCASGDDLRKVTCVVPSCTFTAAPTNVSTGATGKFSASSNNAKLIQMQYRLKGTETWTNLYPNEAGTNPNKSADITCTSAMAGKTYEVKCNAWFGETGTNPKCYGGNGTADGSDYFDCGTNDFKEFSCGTTPSCTLSMTGLSLNPNGTGTLTANVTAESGGAVDRIDFSSNSASKVTVNPVSDNTRSTNSFSTTATAVGSSGQSATITAKGFINGTERCSTTANVTIDSAPVCTGGMTPPASNNTYTVCSDDNTGLSVSTVWSNVSGSSACSSPSGSAPKCQWYCNSGTTWNGSVCEADDPVSCTISPSSTVLIMGGTVTLNLTTTGLGSNPTSTWNKDNASIATLTGSGSTRAATACSSCNTGSTALDSGVTVAVSGIGGKTCTATADIDVAPASSQPCTVSLSPTSATLNAGDKQTFTVATNAPTNAGSGTTVTWVAQTPSVLNIFSTNGLSAVYQGLTAGNSQARVKVQIQPPAGSNLTACETTANVQVNSTVTTVGCNEVCNGSTIVCQSGFVCAELGATDRCRNAVCSSVTSCNCPPGTPGCDMTLTPNTWSPDVGATRNYTATVSNVTNGTLNNVTFSTANSGVVNISGNCTTETCTKQATAVASGTTTITATARVANTDGVCSASKTITVDGSPPSDLACNQTCTSNSECSSGYCHTLNNGNKVCRNNACKSRVNCTCIDACTLTLDPTSLNLNVGQTKKITGTVTNQPSNATIRWSIDDAVAVIGEDPGLSPQLTGEVGGTATLTGQIRVNSTVYCSATASITVNNNPTQVGCNETCNGSSIVCANSNHTCYDHNGDGTTTCRRASCDWDNNCDCQPTVVNACNGSCQGDLGDTGVARVCGSGMTCVSGQCRDAGCPTNASCVCQPPVCNLTSTFTPTDRELFDYTGAAIPGYPRQGTLSTQVEVTDGYLDEIEYSTSQAGVVAIANPQSQTFSDPGTQNESKTLTKNVSAVDLGTTTLQVEGWATGPGGTHLACEEIPTVNVDVLPPPCPEPEGLVLSGDATCAPNTRVINADWNDVTGATKYQIQYDRTDPDASPRSFTINNPISEFNSSSISSPVLGLGEFRVRVRVAEGDGVTCAAYPGDPRWSGWQTAASGKTTVNVRVYENNNWVCGNEAQLQDEGLASGFGSDYGVNYSGSGFNVNGNADEEFTAQVWLCGGDRVMTLDSPDDPWWFPCPNDTTPFNTEQTMDTSDGGVTYNDLVTSASNTAKPWFQVEGGDAHSKGAISVLLPPYADSALRFATRLDGVSESAGMVSAEGGVSVSGNKVREDSNWRVKSRFDATHRKEDYAYFWRLWQMPQTEAQDDGLAGEVKTPEQLVATSPQNLQLSKTIKVLFANGNLNVTAGSFGTSSVVVFVKGDLTISGDVTVVDGGYLAFIVDGNIVIEPSVSLVEGVYIADGNIVVQSTKTNPTSLGTDVQFVGEGVFVGWAGVGLNRDLGEGGDGYDNNTMPAEKFVYRPDLVLNAPEEFKTTQVRMEERAPKDLYVEGYVPPTPTNTPVPGAEPTATPTPTPKDAGMNLITNGDFVSNTNSWGDGQGGTINWELGSGVYKVTDETKFNQLVQTGMTLESGKAYTLSFKAKSTNGRDISASVLKNTNPYTIYDNGGMSKFNLSTEWQNFSETFVASGFNGTVNDVRFRFEMNMSSIVKGDRFWFDDVRLVKVD